MNHAEYWRGLGDELNTRYAAVARDAAQFATIAEAVLRARRVRDQLDPCDVLTQAAMGDVPRQFAERGPFFGQPPITVYAAEDFVIDVYFWFDATTVIHEHGFSGAFQVLAGSSAHTQFSFTEERRINSNFRLGTVVRHPVEFLQVGETRRIDPGNAFAHRLFHLDAPSVTVIARTRAAVEWLPQLDYHPPHIALNAFYTPRSRTLARDACNALAKMDQTRYDAVLLAAAASANRETAYLLLFEHASRFDFDRERYQRDAWPQLVACLQGRFPDELAMYLACLEEEATQRHLRQRREITKDADHRFLLAVLLNTDSRAEMIACARARYPEVDPVDKLVQLLRTMAGPKAGDQVSPLGFELSDDVLQVIEWLLRGVPPSEFGRRFVEAGVEAADVEANLPALVAIEDELRATGGLRALGRA